MEQEYIDSQKRIKRVLLLGTFTTYNKPWHDISDTLSILNNEFSWKDTSHYVKWYVRFFPVYKLGKHQTQMTANFVLHISFMKWKCDMK